MTMASNNIYVQISGRKRSREEIHQHNHLSKKPRTIGNFWYNHGEVSKTKLIISNLDYNVSNDDVFHLFSQFGPIEDHILICDKWGRSCGKAEVTFERRYNAIQAMNFYQGRLFDGRPMRIRENSNNDVEVKQAFEAIV